MILGTVSKVTEDMTVCTVKWRLTWLGWLEGFTFLGKIGRKVTGILLPCKTHWHCLYEASSCFILDFLCDFVLHFDQCSQTTCTDILANNQQTCHTLWLIYSAPPLTWVVIVSSVSSKFKTQRAEWLQAHMLANMFRCWNASLKSRPWRSTIALVVPFL